MDSPMMKHYVRKSSHIAKNRFGIVKTMPIDAFRHGWTSADITYRYGLSAARILGALNDYTSFLCPVKCTNMDLWNNRVGRIVALRARLNQKGQDVLPEMIKKAMDEKKLITSPNKDNREYKHPLFSLFKFIQTKIVRYGN